MRMAESRRLSRHPALVARRGRRPLAGRRAAAAGAAGPRTRSGRPVDVNRGRAAGHTLRLGVAVFIITGALLTAVRLAEPNVPAAYVVLLAGKIALAFAMFWLGAAPIARRGPAPPAGGWSRVDAGPHVLDCGDRLGRVPAVGNPQRAHRTRRAHQSARLISTARTTFDALTDTSESASAARARAHPESAHLRQGSFRRRRALAARSDF